jgi:hypothetical protein
MTAETEVDSSCYSSLNAASKELSLRTAIRRASPPTEAGDGASPESPEQQEAADRAALLKWLKWATELLAVWHEHLTTYADHPIDYAEVELLIERLLKVRADMATHFYKEDSLLSLLDYAEKVNIWKAELVAPWELLKDALYPYRNALRRVDFTKLRDNPAKDLEFEYAAYLRSKEIRKLFAEYKEQVSAQLTAIRGVVEHGN